MAGEQKEKAKERQKTLKEEEKARKKAEKAQKKGARDSAAIVPGADAGPDPARADEVEPQEPRPQEGSQRNAGSRSTSGNPDDGAKEPPFSPGKVKSWLRSKLTRQKPTAKDRDTSELGRGFVGGHAARSPEPGTEDSEAASFTGETGAVAKPSQSRLVGARVQTPIQGDSEEPPRTPLERGFSSGTDDSFEDAREGATPQRTPPRIIGALNPRASPSRDSRFVEMMD